MKKFKVADFLKWPFFKIANSQKFSRKFHRLVLGLVRLNDAKGINVTQPIWRSGQKAQAQKSAKTAFFVFLDLFWAYIGQPDGHIG